MLQIATFVYLHPESHQITLIVMITKSSIPSMSVADMRRLQDILCRRKKSDFSTEEWRVIQERKASMRLAGKLVSKHNGGKNPILCF